MFSASGAVGFVVGFAMFGALTFLPLFFQDARGISPTLSGLRLLPLMGGLLLASIGSGQLVSRWGRYKVFPVVGTFLMSVGLFLMSRIGLHTGSWTIAGYMFVFGVGLGLVMQILVVAVQNAVPYEKLGTATSGAMFFRSIGGSFGTAVFGAVFANLLVSNVVNALHLSSVPATLRSSLGAADPTSLAHLPPAIHAGVVAGLVHTIQTVFLIATPIALLAFALSWLLPEVELRQTVRTVDTGEGFGMPRADPRSRRFSSPSKESQNARTAPSSTPRSQPVQAWISSPGPAGCSTDWPTDPTARSRASRRD